MEVTFYFQEIIFISTELYLIHTEKNRKGAREKSCFKRVFDKD